MDERRTKQLIEAVGICRALVLEDCELEFSGSARWRLMRSRLLRAFGERGLEGRILNIMSRELHRE